MDVPFKFLQVDLMSRYPDLKPGEKGFTDQVNPSFRGMKSYRVTGEK